MVPRRTIWGMCACLTLVVAGSGCATVDQASEPPASTADPSSDTVDQDANGVRLLTVRHSTTVIDDSERPPQLCVGGVQESFPPQCAGIDLVGWSWDEVDGEFELRNDVRWGEFVVAGDYSPEDNSLTVTSVEVGGPAPSIGDSECVDETDTDIDMRAIQDEIHAAYDGEELIFWSGTNSCGVLEVGVAYDDGTVQADVDQKYGPGVVSIHSVLVQVE